MEKYNNKKRKIYNNGKLIGTIVIFSGVAIISSFVLSKDKLKTDASKYKTTISSDDTKNDDFDINSIIKNGIYDEVPYRINENTMGEIALKYTNCGKGNEWDESREILRKNNLSENALNPGNLIYLYDVPYSKLESLGYKVKDDINTRINYINENYNDVIDNCNYDTKKVIDDSIAVIKSISDNLSSIEDSEYVNNHLDILTKKILKIYSSNGYTYQGEIESLQNVKDKDINNDKLYTIPYTVKEGDTISGIVSRYTEDDTEETKNEYIAATLMESGIEDPSSIKPGDKIEIYGVEADELKDFNYTISPEDLNNIDEMKMYHQYIENEKNIISKAADMFKKESNNPYKSLLLKINEYEELYSNTVEVGKFSEGIYQKTLDLAEEIHNVTNDDYDFEPMQISSKTR